MQLQIIGKNGVGKRTLVDILQQHFELELVTSRSDVSIYLFDISDQNSLEYLRNRYTDMQCRNTYLVGNKLDLIDRRKVSSENALKFSAKYGMSYHEISCITKQNVSHLVYTLQLVMQQQGFQSSQRFKKSSTIQVLKFNRISLKNVNVSHTESEASPNTNRKEIAQSSPKKILPPQLTQQSIETPKEFNLNQNSIHLRRVQTKIESETDSPLKSQQMTIQQEEPQPIIPVSLQNLNQFNSNTTPKNFRMSRWIEGEGTSKNSAIQRSPSKLPSQVFTSRSIVNELNNSQDKFTTLIDKMKNTITQIKSFQIESHQQQQDNYEMKCEIIFDSFNSELFKPVETQQVQPKKESINIYEISQLLKTEQTQQTQQTQSQNQNNYFNKKSNRVKQIDQNISIELKEQVNRQFNITPERQTNYKSITPGRQIIKCVDINDNRNDKLFSLQYRLKSGKFINVVMKRKDNLIQVAQDIAQKYKLEHNSYVQLLRMLKEKYRTILQQ